jgi:dTDP-glucose 4,6-dehydratase
VKILVTGGAGFIGSNFIHLFLESAKFKESQLFLLDAMTYAGNEKTLRELLIDERIKFIKGNICDSELVGNLTKEVDVVVNFAAESHVDRSIALPNEFIESNILGTHNLLFHSMKNNVKKFIQVSTDEVYGSIEHGSWDETKPLEPNSPYSASKASADLVARSYFQTYHFPVIITRCSNNFGPYQNLEKFIPKSITSALSGNPIEIYGNGTNIRDWIHVSDHCRALLLLIDVGTAGEVYNIGSGNELSNLDLAQKILSLMNLPEANLKFITDRKGHDQRYSVNYSKIEKLGFQPVKDFNRLLSETIVWYKSNPNWWSQQN